MKLGFRLRFRRLKALFLGRFAEVRLLRNMEGNFQTQARAFGTRIFALEDEKKRLSSILEEKERGLEVMTTARMNAERQLDVMRGELDGLREVNEREVLGLKQMVDFWALEARGRQIFGVAPTMAMPTPEPEQKAAPFISMKQATAQLTRKFYEDAMKLGQTPPPNGAEYSSARDFSKESTATS